jgi:hypothetical protein
MSQFLMADMDLSLDSGPSRAARSGLRQVRLVRRGGCGDGTAAGAGGAARGSPSAAVPLRTNCIWRATDGEADGAAAGMPGVLHLRLTAVGKGGRAAGAKRFLQVRRAADAVVLAEPAESAAAAGSRAAQPKVAPLLLTALPTTTLLPLCALGLRRSASCRRSLQSETTKRRAQRTAGQHTERPAPRCRLHRPSKDLGQSIKASTVHRSLPLVVNGIKSPRIPPGTSGRPSLQPGPLRCQSGAIMPLIRKESAWG